MTNADAIRHSKPYWASPNDAANYKKAKELAASTVFMNSEFPTELSAFETQLFLRHGSSHILHTPTMGCALVDAVTAAFATTSLGVWVAMESTPVAIANHGEVLVNWKGKVKSLTSNRVEYQAIHQAFKPTMPLYVYGTLQSYNANAGLITIGVPAITAITGAVENIRLKAGIEENIPFAFGVANNKWNLTSKKGAETYQNSGKAASVILHETEKSGNCDFCLVLDAKDSSLDELAKAINSLQKIAGGSVFNLNITQVPPKKGYQWLARLDKYQDDKIAQVLQRYAEKRSMPMLVGYRLLQAPSSKSGLRNSDYLHAYSEGIYAPVTYMQSPVFWQYQQNNDLCFADILN